MAMELEGKIVRKLNVQNGTSAKGAWSKQEFIFEYQEGNFPSQVCMHVWGEDKVKDLDKYQVGDKVKVSFNLSSREFNGRWYTDVRAWRIEPAGVTAPASVHAPEDSKFVPFGTPTGQAQPQASGQSFVPFNTPNPEAPMPTASDMSFPDEDLPF